MKVIGITGCSGSGKTTISEILRNKSIEVIDCDKVSKKMAEPGTDYLKAIEKTFGKEILLENGNLNRKKLASLIYISDVERKKLNELTFKYVVEEIEKILLLFKNENKEIVGIDAPLLFEANLHKQCDYIILVTASEEVQAKRICLRDNISEEEALSRLKIQHREDFYKNYIEEFAGNMVILENGDDNIEKLEENIENILNKVKEDKPII